MQVVLEIRMMVSFLLLGTTETGSETQQPMGGVTCESIMETVTNMSQITGNMEGKMTNIGGLRSVDQSMDRSAHPWFPSEPNFLGLLANGGDPRTVDELVSTPTVPADDTVLDPLFREDITQPEPTRAREKRPYSSRTFDATEDAQIKN
uniref:Integrase core domain containing protein n=1 Tax=Solanum tuberosum TaxID=4113 RepID=M1DWR6_SOLTU